MSVTTSWLRGSKWKPRSRRRKRRPEKRTSGKAVSATSSTSNSSMANVEQRLENALSLWRLTLPWQGQIVSANIPVVEAFEKGVKDFENDMNSCEPSLVRQPLREWPSNQQCNHQPATASTTTPLTTSPTTSPSSALVSSTTRTSATA